MSGINKIEFVRKANPSLWDRQVPLAFLLLLLLLVLPGCDEKKSPSQNVPEKTSLEETREINLKETKLAVIPEDYDRWSNISFSADGRQVFYIARKKNREFIVVATTGGTY